MMLEQNTSFTVSSLPSSTKKAQNDAEAKNLVLSPSLMYISVYQSTDEQLEAYATPSSSEVC